MTTKKTETKTAAPKQEIRDDSVDADKQVAAPRRNPPLSEQLKMRGVSNEAWHTLTGSVFPGAKYASILLAIDYCRARKLDVLKKPCHIVPMEVEREGDDGRKVKVWQDVIMPGIYELRTTAHRTGKYLGHTQPEFGPDFEFFTDFSAPTYCAMVFKRATDDGVAEFPVVAFFNEVVGTKNYGKEPNARWKKAPRQMLIKCCEAAGLREAFPEEIGGDHAAEEMDSHDETPLMPPQPPQTPPTSEGGSDELNAELGLVDDGARAAAIAAQAASEASQDVP